MKGRGTRGMPGKGATAAGSSGGGFNKASKKKMQARELGKDEWTLVAAKGELGDEVGSTLAVEAGQSPMGQNYIWTLIRGKDGAGQFDTDVYSNVYVTDGSCRACSFPMTKSIVTFEEAIGDYAVECPNCGSQWALGDGSVLKWLPGEGPVQFLAKKLNEKKEPMEAGVLKTRVSQSGRVYLRLPDGTLKIEKTAAERAAELASGEGLKEVAKNVQTLSERVAAAQQKASS